MQSTPQAFFVSVQEGAHALLQLCKRKLLLEGRIISTDKSIARFLKQDVQSVLDADSPKRIAALLAGTALRNGISVASSREQPIVGIALFASKTNYFLSSWDKYRAVNWQFEVDNNSSEDKRDALISDVVLKALLHPPEQHDKDHKEEEVKITSSVNNISDAVKELYNEKRKFILIKDDGSVSENRSEKDIISPQQKRVILPGSFNPLHEGHISLLTEAAKWLQTQFRNENIFTCFELSAFNPDKPPIEEDKLLDRLVQFAGRFNILATNAPTFIQKARMFPHSTFVVGIDTANRIVQSKYYDNSEEKMMNALLEFKSLGCSFLVAGRTVQGHFVPAADMNVPPSLRDIFLELPEFRMDISSTELRAKGIQV